MLNVRHILCVSLIVALLASLGLSAVTISKDGQANAVIVVAADASEPEQYAARELAEFLGQITGGTFKVLSKEDEQTSCIFVGPGAARQADAQFSTDGLAQRGSSCGRSATI